MEFFDIQAAKEKLNISTPATSATTATLKPKTDASRGSSESRSVSVNETKIKSRVNRKSRKVLENKILSSVLLKGLAVDVKVVRSKEETVAALETLLVSSKSLGLDVETTPLDAYRSDEKAGLDPHRSRIRLVQVYCEQTAYVFDLNYVSLSWLTSLWSKSFIAYNAVFELKHLLHKGVVLPDCHCSLLMSRVVYGVRYKLDEVTKKVFTWPIDKTLQKSDWGTPELTDEQYAYAALDSVLAFKLSAHLSPIIKEKGVSQAYQLMCDAQYAIAKQELRGIQFDREKHTPIVLCWEREFEQAKSELVTLWGEDLNAGSYQQVSNWLEGNLPKDRLVTWLRSPTGYLKTDKDTLGFHADLPIIKPLLTYKTYEKNLSTYGRTLQNKINPITKRLHSGFLIAQARTGRFSSTAPNVQNPPNTDSFRSLFIAGTGRKLVVADFSQIELRIAAILSQDKAMLQAYENGGDLHRATASAISRVPVENIIKQQRQAAKAINFGLLYGQGAKGLRRTAQASYGVDMTLDEAKEARKTFFRAYPKLYMWQARTIAQAEQNLYVTTPAGLYRHFTKSNFNPRAALNTPVQGGGAEVLLITLALLDKALTGLDADIVNHVHDEIVLDVSEDDVSKASNILQDCMVNAFLTLFPNACVRDLVEVGVGDNWAEAK